MTTQQDPTTLYTLASSLLQREEETVGPVDLADWQTHWARRRDLEHHIQQCEQAAMHLRQRLDALPALAQPEQVCWAQALLAFPNLAFLEVETDGIYDDADILCIVLVDAAGTPLFDQMFRPRHPLLPRIAHLTGITPAMLAHSPTLSEAWPEVVQACTGRYVLSFNLAFDQGKLSESAVRYGLPTLPLIGDCLMLHAQQYYGASSYPKLADLSVSGWACRCPVPARRHALHRRGRCPRSGGGDRMVSPGGRAGRAHRAV